jgi:hypothetical protein
MHSHTLEDIASAARKLPREVSIGASILADADETVHAQASNDVPLAKRERKVPFVGMMWGDRPSWVFNGQVAILDSQWSEALANHAANIQSVTKALHVTIASPDTRMVKLYY